MSDDLTNTLSSDLFANQTIHESAYQCLMEIEATDKVAQTNALYEISLDTPFRIEPDQKVASLPVPGRPLHPELVAPRELARRTMKNSEGQAALVHSIAHIEFNAINLALDVVYRFRGQDESFYRDWLRVAKEEAYHYSLLASHLEKSGHAYGDFVAHNGLWAMAVETDYDVLVRMALVPRVMEARGLDVTPGIMAKFEQIGDQDMVDILNIIQRDEIGHVEIGTRWYRFFCQQRGLSPLETFKLLIKKHMQGGVRGPYDYDTRKQAGFTDDELKYLEQVGAK